MAFAAALSSPDMRRQLTSLATTAALAAVIGIELLVLVTWTPDTLRVWFDPETNGYGDFPVFFDNAKKLALTNMYSPGLPLLMYPLTKLSMADAFLIYTGVNVGALAGIAWLAQRGVTSVPAKAAVTLGVFALPQTHWALRVGHFTEVIALASLCGFLLCERRPVLASIAVAAIALKPQYLAAPLLYLLLTRNWRALAASFGGLAALAFAGVAGMALRDPGAFGSTAEYYVGAVPELIRYATVGQGDANYTQSWQYSWYGFLVSIGVERNPLIAIALTCLTLAAMLLAWQRCSPSVAKVAFALGTLLIVPHTTFYNWSMLSVAFVLLLHSDLRPRALMPMLIAGMAIAAAATQQATPWPLPVDRFRPAGTLGVYWLQPAALAAICMLAIAGRRAADDDAAERPLTPREPMFVRVRSLGAAAALAACAAAVGFVTAAYVSNSGPFQSEGYFSRAAVLAAVPVDFPLPDNARVRSAGAGERLPYRVEWQSDARVSEVAGSMRVRLDDGSWSIVAPADDGDSATVDLRSARGGDGVTPVIAELHVAPASGGSLLRLEFSPLPSSSVPGYDEWLSHIGLVVHDVAPSLIEEKP